MDIDRVRYFHVFAATGSLVRAAEILHISQPALSKALRLLQTETGLKLLEAEGRGLRLTAVGKAFHTASAPLLEQWRHLPEKIRGEESTAPTRIGSFEVFTTYFLAPLLQHTSLEDLAIHELGPGALENAIAENRVDIGITYLPIPHAGVEFIEATKIRMGIYGPAKGFAQTPWQGLPFTVPITPAQGTPSKVQGLDGWPDHKFPRKIKYRVTLMASAIELCRQGKSVAYLPDFIVRLHNEAVKPQLRLLEFPGPLPLRQREQSVYLVQRKHSADSPLQKQIARCLRSLRN